MRALLLDEAGPRVADLPLPVAAGEALLRLRVGGVCATDLELVKGYMGFRGVLGHEFVAEVAEGPAELVGRRVVGGINAACGACATCLAGRPTHCPHRSVLGIDGRDGAFAECFRLPACNLLPVPESVPDEAAVFVEPLAAALQILQQVHVRPSDRCVVLGVGRLGQLIVRVLALMGARVQALSRNPARLALLPEGVEGVLPEDKAQLAGADLVVDATGNPAGLGEATALLRPRGTLVLKTTTHDVPQPPVIPWVLNEINVVGSRCGPFAPALRLLERGLVDPTPLVTDRYPLAEGVAALQAAAQPGSVKVLLEG